MLFHYNFNIDSRESTSGIDPRRINTKLYRPSCRSDWGGRFANSVSISSREIWRL